jgi:hypothetical protein
METVARPMLAGTEFGKSRRVSRYCARRVIQLSLTHQLLALLDEAGLQLFAKSLRGQCSNSRQKEDQDRGIVRMVAFRDRDYLTKPMARRFRPMSIHAI